MSSATPPTNSANADLDLLKRTIFVGNLPSDVNERDLRRTFEAVCEDDVTDVRIALCRDQSRTFAFLTLSKQASVDKAISGLHRRKMGECVILVDRARRLAPRLQTARTPVHPLPPRPAVSVPPLVRRPRMPTRSPRAPSPEPYSSRQSRGLSPRFQAFGEYERDRAYDREDYSPAPAWDGRHPRSQRLQERGRSRSPECRSRPESYVVRPQRYPVDLRDGGYMFRRERTRSPERVWAAYRDPRESYWPYY